MVEKQSAVVPKRNVCSLGCAATAMSIVRMTARISANGVKSLAISVMNNLRENVVALGILRSCPLDCACLW